ncbi:hypothetical protein ACJX0J_009389, partial [Zea mays]
LEFAPRSLQPQVSLITSMFCDFIINIPYMTMSKFKIKNAIKTIYLIFIFSMNEARINWIEKEIELNIKLAIRRPRKPYGMCKCHAVVSLFL